MKKILLSLLGLILVISLVGLGAFAIFSDTETSTGNIFQAGTLDLEIGGSVTVPITLGNMKPGDGMTGSEHGGISYWFTVRNVGSLDGKLQITVTNVRNYENGRNEPEAIVDGTGGNPGLGNGELGQYLIMQINWPGGPGFHYYHCGNPSGNCAGNERGHTINCWENVVMEEAGFVLHAGETLTNGVLEFMLPSSVGNIIQSDSVEFDIMFHLDQS